MNKAKKKRWGIIIILLIKSHRLVVCSAGHTQGCCACLFLNPQLRLLPAQLYPPQSIPSTAAPSALPLQTNIPPTCKSTGLLRTYLSLSYASLRIYYISYLQCVLLRFLEKISFHKKQRLCQPGATASPRGTRGNPSRQPVQPRQKYPQPRTTAETSPKTPEESQIYITARSRRRKAKCQADSVLTQAARYQQR